MPKDARIGSDEWPWGVDCWSAFAQGFRLRSATTWQAGATGEWQYQLGGQSWRGL